MGHGCTINFQINKIKQQKILILHNQIVKIKMRQLKNKMEKN